MYEYRCRCERVVDGDTLDLAVDLGFRVQIGIRVRLEGLDAPEVRGPERPEGLKATAFAKDWVEARQANGLELPIIVRTNKTGKYGRWLAEVFDLEGHSLNVALVETGHAKKS